MAYCIEFTSNARQQYQRLDEKTTRIVDRALERFSEGPIHENLNYSGNVVRLKNHENEYRYKAGRYRIFYDIDEENEKYIITAIAIREGAYG